MIFESESSRSHMPPVQEFRWLGSASDVHQPKGLGATGKIIANQVRYGFYRRYACHSTYRERIFPLHQPKRLASMIFVVANFANFNENHDFESESLSDPKFSEILQIWEDLAKICCISELRRSSWAQTLPKCHQLVWYSIPRIQ